MSKNNDRSDVKNPNNDKYKNDQDNRANQLNPNNNTYWSDRGNNLQGGKDNSKK